MNSKPTTYLGSPDEQSALDKHFNQLLKDRRKSNQEKHGERVEARQKERGSD